jgi:hypothetical protein
LPISTVVIVFAQLAVPEELALVRGAEILAERRGLFHSGGRKLLFAAIRNRSDTKNNETESKDVDQQLSILQVIHRVLHRIGGALQPEETRWRQRQIYKECEAAEKGSPVNIARPVLGHALGAGWPAATRLFTLTISLVQKIGQAN